MINFNFFWPNNLFHSKSSMFIMTKKIYLRLNQSAQRYERKIWFVDVSEILETAEKFWLYWLLVALLITLCFVLADDLHVDILKFVAGHGTVVQPVSINIVFGCKQAHQYGRRHQLGFIRAVTWSSKNAESYWSPLHITFTVEHFSFHAFYKCGLKRDLMSCSSRLTLQRR